MLFSHEEEGNPTLWITWIDLGGATLSDVNPTVKDSNLGSYFYMKSKKLHS